MTNPSGDQMIGRTVAQYQILARRGGGGMGVVYEARDTKLGRRVALKFLPPQWSHDEAAKQRFVREAQAASATDHPNICTIHDIATADDGQLFIVMAYYEGETLKQRLAAGMLAVHEALDIATQVADGLARAHAKGVVHRDIKPGNLILTEDGVRIVDFGLATLVNALQLTAPGSTLGTAAYMSPEQARGEEADARADVWAVGVILYEMLSGHVPFQGAFAEAIAYAIRNDPPAPLRQARPEVPEDVEHLVFRALHKDPAIRYQNGRELARALRQARGFTLPMDLRTEAVDVRRGALAPVAASRARGRLSMMLAAAVVIAALLATSWLLWPVRRTPVLVAPVVNLTGFDELDPYRLALTYSIISRLAESRDVRPVMYTRMLPALRRFIDKDDLSRVSSREAVHALAQHADASIVLVPTLLYEDGAWSARVEFLNAETMAGAGLPAYESDRRFSSLAPVTSYELAGALAAGIRERFTSARSRALDWVLAPLQADVEAQGFLQSHDAALAFERGLRAYEALEYAQAADAMGTAEQHDPNHPLPAAWLSRVALVMGERQVAMDAAARARARVTDRTRRTDALFAEAVAFEARGEMDTAEDAYRALVDEHPDQLTWRAELAAFHDRRGAFDDAVTAYHDILESDPAFIKAALALCRLYDSTRKNQPDLAITFGRQARTMYAAVSDRLGEAQALLCLAETLRGGDDDQRAEAASHVDEALGVFEAHGASYNVARALQYAALVRVGGDLRAAITYFERSLAAAEAAGNTELQARVASNLGVSHELLGAFAKGLEYYDQSYRLSEARRDERLAAYNQANAGALRIWNGIDPERGLRDVENALAVVRRLEARNFELLCLQALAAFHRFAGDYDAAEIELNRALAIATELGDRADLTSLALHRARLQIDTGSYGAAIGTLSDGEDEDWGARRGEAALLLGWAYTRVGDHARADEMLARAEAEFEARSERGLLPELHLARGQLALEAGNRDLARQAFARSSDFWRDDLPDRASVEARAYLGWIDAERGRVRDGRALVERSLEQAERMRNAALEARCRVLLARINLLADEPDAAAAALAAAPLGRLGADLQALVHHWRAESQAALGDRAGSRRERDAARRAVAALAGRNPEQYRSAIAARPDIMAVVQQPQD